MLARHAGIGSGEHVDGSRNVLIGVSAPVPPDEVSRSRW